jgi:hypothetical protein
VIGPFSVVDRIADGLACRLEIPSHMNLHPTFYIILLKHSVHDTEPSCIRPALMPDLFADGKEEREVSASVSHRWRASHLQYLVSWVGLAEHDSSWVSESDSANSPTFVKSTGHLEAVPALGPHARGNDGAGHEDFPLHQNRNIQSVQAPRKTVFQKRPTTAKCRIRGHLSRV